MQILKLYRSGLLQAKYIFYIFSMHESLFEDHIVGKLVMNFHLIFNILVL